MQFGPEGTRVVSLAASQDTLKSGKAEGTAALVPEVSVDDDSYTAFSRFAIVYNCSLQCACICMQSTTAACGTRMLPCIVSGSAAQVPATLTLQIYDAAGKLDQVGMEHTGSD